MFKAISIFAAHAYAAKIESSSQSLTSQQAAPVEFTIEFTDSRIQKSDRVVKGSLTGLEDYCDYGCSVTLDNGKKCKVVYGEFNGDYKNGYLATEWHCGNWGQTLECY